MSRVIRLAAADCVLAVIDVQEKLLPLIPRTPELLVNLSFLLDAARLLEVPTLATEQYPKGLGPTSGVLIGKLPKPIPSKVEFSCSGSGEFVDGLARHGRRIVITAGIETHVCVLQTALDLIERDFQVVVPADAVAGRYAIDHEIALRRLERAGAVIATSEMIVFEWTRSAGHPQFKLVSGLVQERARELRRAAASGSQA